MCSTMFFIWFSITNDKNNVIIQKSFGIDTQTNISTTFVRSVFVELWPNNLNFAYVLRFI